MIEVWPQDVMRFNPRPPGEGRATGVIEVWPQDVMSFNPRPPGEGRATEDRAAQ